MSGVIISANLNSDNEKGYLNRVFQPPTLADVEVVRSRQARLSGLLFDRGQYFANLSSELTFVWRCIEGEAKLIRTTIGF